jgi:hypothetical protein
VPPGKSWVAGYWRPDGDNQRWVPGFWTTAKAEREDITYLPAPPEPPRIADPGAPPAVDCFYVPGVWVWTGTTYRWRAGYWGRIHPGYVWVSDHYRWTPSGYVYVVGYWDLAIARRGVLYAPVFISPRVRLAVGFVYTPSYAVRDTVIVEAMFVRPAFCHYYFGDYYGPRYVGLGFTSAVVYSRRRYEPIIAYEVYARRSTPTWLSVQINLYNDRYAGRAPLPPRTLALQTTVVRTRPGVTSITTIAPARTVVAARGAKVVAVSVTERRAAVAYAAKVKVAAAARVKVEVATRPGVPHAARTSSLTVAATPRPTAAARIERPRVPPARPAPHTTRDKRRDDKDRRSPR